MSGGLHSLATIIKRLEAATSRLEDIALAGSNSAQAPQGVPSSDVTPANERSGGDSGSNVEQEPRSVRAFDDTIVNARLRPWVELSRQLGGPIDEQAKLIEAEIMGLRTIILTAALCAKPDSGTIGSLLEPLKKANEAITRVKDSNRSSREWYNHLATVADGSSFVGWVTVESKPASYIGEYKDSSQFYANRLIKEFKDKNQKHVDWARSYIAIIEEMRKYVMEWHATGLQWNSKGISVSEYISKSSASASSNSAPPAPPPPPPPPPPADATAMSPPPAAGPAAVFAELNRGADVTKGLRKVDKSEMTHKNPSLRASSTVASPSNGAPKKPVKPTKPSSLTSKKPPKFALEGSKWVIEHQENESAIVVENTEIRQVVSIFGCKNTTVQVKGKVNAISMLNCVKTSVLVENVISSVSITSSPSFALQITGSAPTIQIDSTDSGQLYLSTDCFNAEIITAKCSAINVSIPDASAGADEFVERAIPEMMRSVIKDGQLITNIVEHSA